MIEIERHVEGRGAAWDGFRDYGSESLPENHKAHTIARCQRAVVEVEVETKLCEDNVEDGRQEPKLVRQHRVG